MRRSTNTTLPLLVVVRPAGAAARSLCDCGMTGERLRELDLRYAFGLSLASLPHGLQEDVVTARWTP